MGDEMGSIDCPDCQLQMLQQNQTASQVSEHSQVQVSIHDSIHNTNRSIHQDINVSSLNKPITFSQDRISPHYQIGSLNSNNTARVSNSSGNSCMNVYSYGSDSVGNFHVPTSVGNSNLSLPLGNSSIGSMSVSTSSTALTTQGSEMNLNAVPIEPCDFNGYCSTCAVLELPTNDKFYRSSNSRAHVFPPIFYPQGPSTVIPCFSPIPDWNEYNHYAYSAPYSQSAPTVQAPTDYYGSSSTTIGSSSTVSTYDNNITESLTSSSALLSSYSSGPCSSLYSNANNIRNDCTSGLNEDCDAKKSSNNNTQTKIECSTETPLSISSSSSSYSEISDVESSCDSEIGHSILSEDRELISVVEDDEEEESNDTKTLRQTCESARPDGKCWICHNSLEITDCSSPQLAKILENIDEDITAEDLDITVSSGDIEIGGIEDEVKDFHNIKKRNESGNCQGIFSISRLAALLGTSSKSFNSDSHGSETDIAVLCFRCNKLASLADSLEKDLSSAINKLHQKINSSHLPLIPLPPSIPFMPPRGFRTDESSLNSFPSLQYRRFDTKEIQTQTDFEEDQFNCKSEIFSLQKCLGLHQIESQSQDLNQQTANLWKPDDQHSHSDNGLEFVTESCLVITPIDNSPSTLNEECSPNRRDCVDSEPPLSFLGNTITTPTEHIENNHKDIIQHNEIQHSSESVVSIINKVDWSRIEIESENMVASANDFNPEKSENVDCSNNHNMKEQSEEIINETDSITINPDIIGNIPKVFKGDISVPLMDSQNSAETIACVQQPTDASLCQKLSLCCFYCQRIFSTKSNMKAHAEICKFKMSHEQQNVSPKTDKSCMECPQCGLGFRSSIRRNKHIEQGCKSITFECPKCSKRFSKNSELKAHMNLHLGEKPFRCEVCDVSFATRGNQVAHSRIHSNSKKFSCTHCDKGFNRKYALLVHLNRHNGIKPFSCNLCSKSFPDPSNLANHKKKSHR